MSASWCQYISSIHNHVRIVNDCDNSVRSVSFAERFFSMS